jgi:hypothetical protein
MKKRTIDLVEKVGVNFLFPYAIRTTHPILINKFRMLTIDNNLRK